MATKGMSSSCTLQTEPPDWLFNVGIQKSNLFNSITVMGFSFVLFDVSKEIYRGKFTLGNAGYTYI